MLRPSAANTVNRMVFARDAAVSAGVNGVMPATPEMTLVTRVAEPPADGLASRYTLGMPSGVAMKYNAPSPPNSGFELRAAGNPANSRGWPPSADIAAMR